MSVYYPQAAMKLRILWEDFGEVQSENLQKIYTISAIARSLTVNINDYKTADTFNCEIDFKQFPFDPRCIRSCGVKIYMEDLKRLYGETNKPVVIEPSDENALFIGYADESSITLDEGKRVVKMEGRDFTSLLIDRKILKPDTFDKAGPLDQRIKSILAELPETKDLKVSIRLLGDVPNLSKNAPSLSPLNTAHSRKNEETYWELIQSLVAQLGLICFIELDTLVITQPRALYSNTDTISFVYGRNIKNLQFKRKLGRKKNFNVVVRSTNLLSKQSPVITAYIPREATAEWSHATGIPNGKDIEIPTMTAEGVPGPPGSGHPAPLIALLVPNIASHKALVEIGQSIYEELGRQQIEGSFETKDMDTISGKEECFNLLKLRNGSALKITVNQGDLAGINKVVKPTAKGEEKQKSIESTRKFLLDRGYSTEVSAALAETLNNPRFDSPFYTKAVQFTMDAESGFHMKVEFINFIELPKRLGGSA